METPETTQTETPESTNLTTQQLDSAVCFGVVPFGDKKFIPVCVVIEGGQYTWEPIGSPTSMIENVYAVASEALEEHGIKESQYRYGRKTEDNQKGTFDARYHTEDGRLRDGVRRLPSQDERKKGDVEEESE